MTGLTAASRRRSRTALAVVATAISLTAFTPVFAAGPNAGNGPRHGAHGQQQDGHDQRLAHRGDRGPGGKGMGMGMGRGAPGNMLVGLGCGPNAAERIEHALVSLSYRINPTDAQKPLLDDLKTTALAAQKTFAASCDKDMPGDAAMAGPMDGPMAGPMGGDDAMMADPQTEANAAPADAAPRANLLEMMQTRLKLDQARVTAMAEILPKFEALYNSLSDEQKASLEPRGFHHRGPGPAGAPEAGGPAAPRNG